MSATIFSDMYSGDSEIVAEGACTDSQRIFRSSVPPPTIAEKTHISGCICPLFLKQGNRSDGLRVHQKICDCRRRKKLRNSTLGITEIALSCGFRRSTASPSFSKKSTAGHRADIARIDSTFTVSAIIPLT